MRRFVNCSMVVVLWTALVSTGFSDDWNRFRGPNGSGISTEAAPLATTWSDTENLKWKVALPGAGFIQPNRGRG